MGITVTLTWKETEQILTNHLQEKGFNIKENTLKPTYRNIATRGDPVYQITGVQVEGETV